MYQLIACAMGGVNRHVYFALYIRSGGAGGEWSLDAVVRRIDLGSLLLCRDIL